MTRTLDLEDLEMQKGTRVMAKKNRVQSILAALALSASIDGTVTAMASADSPNGPVERASISSLRVHANLTVDLGLRYECNVTPTEREDRWVVFDAPTASLLRIVVHRDRVYGQNHNLEPRLGVGWNPSVDGRTLLRTAYALTVEQPLINAVSREQDHQSAGPAMLTCVTLS